MSVELDAMAEADIVGVSASKGPRRIYPSQDGADPLSPVFVSPAVDRCEHVVQAPCLLGDAVGDLRRDRRCNLAFNEACADEGFQLAGAPSE